MNAVLGMVTEDSIDYLVFVENAQQDSAAIACNKANLKQPAHLTVNPGNTTQFGTASLTEPWHDLLCLTPLEQNGRELLVGWDAPSQIVASGAKETDKKLVVYTISSQLFSSICSNFQFSAHLWHLVDVIFALNDDSNNILDFRCQHQQCLCLGLKHQRVLG